MGELSSFRFRECESLCFESLGIIKVKVVRLLFVIYEVYF